MKIVAEDESTEQTRLYNILKKCLNFLYLLCVPDNRGRSVDNYQGTLLLIHH